MIKIEYETPEGVESLERDEWHSEKPNMITGYDLKATSGIEHKVSIPIQRVIKIYG